MQRLLIGLLALGGCPLSFAGDAIYEYSVVLKQPAIARRIASRTELLSVSARSAASEIERAQRDLRNVLAERGIRDVASARVLLNAVFVHATEEQARALRQLPGVVRVARSREFQMQLSGALPAAGVPGAGVKIGIIDSGIDRLHPGFQDPSLPMPPGFPLCAGADCAFTSNKVIVARSYVRLLV
jgi:subtilisin family serine protease